MFRVLKYIPALIESLDRYRSGGRLFVFMFCFGCASLVGIHAVWSWSWSQHPPEPRNGGAAPSLRPKSNQSSPVDSRLAMGPETNRYPDGRRE
ncbi:hypothetical protein ASC87_19830 [Rhizobacter sp. Root1221]|nr:hypothetical protein ASC87_19830 [Rhizobacter sp. Root1221]